MILHARLIEFSIFSPNETLEDISTRDLVYLTVPYVFSEVQNRVSTTEPTDRLTSLIQAEVSRLSGCMRCLSQIDLSALLRNICEILQACLRSTTSFRRTNKNCMVELQLTLRIFQREGS